MRSAFIDKLIKRMDRLEPGEIQSVVVELMKEKRFMEKTFQALQEGVINGTTDGMPKQTIAIEKVRVR